MMSRFAMLCFGLAVLSTLTPTPGLGQTVATATAYTPPRTTDGHPDLQGIWQVVNTAAWDLEDHGAGLGVPAGHGVVEGDAIPYQASALAKRRENFEQRATLDPETKCYLPGVPRITYMPHPFQIIQQANKVSIAYEYLRTVRFIHMNGIPHPPGPIDWWMGDSRGHWEGNTLVVDVVHYRGRDAGRPAPPAQIRTRPLRHPALPSGSGHYFADGKALVRPRVTDFQLGPVRLGEARDIVPS